MNGARVRAAHLRQLIDETGGFTVGHLDGRPAEQGISVCTRPSRSLSFAWQEWDDRMVDAWLAARSAEYGWRWRYIGGWLDRRTDQVWLDVVRIVPARYPAVANLMGRAMQQHCVFDLGRGETVRLGRSAA